MIALSRCQLGLSIWMDGISSWSAGVCGGRWQFCDVSCYGDHKEKETNKNKDAGPAVSPFNQTSANFHTVLWSRNCSHGCTQDVQKMQGDFTGWGEESIVGCVRISLGGAPKVHSFSIRGVITCSVTAPLCELQRQIKRRCSKIDSADSFRQLRGAICSGETLEMDMDRKYL